MAIPSRLMSLTDGEIVACPIWEATYKAVNKNGKIKLEAFIYEDDDLGEL